MLITSIDSCFQPFYLSFKQDKIEAEIGIIFAKLLSPNIVLFGSRPFIILCGGLFLPDVLCKRLQTLSQSSLGFGEVCYDFF